SALTVELRARRSWCYARRGNASSACSIGRWHALEHRQPGSAEDLDMRTPGEGLTYADAGVDIDAGNALVERIKPAAAATARPGVMAGLGGFGALFDLKAAGYAAPIRVAATDGVGTKLRVAIETGLLDGVGRDL